jgi:multicomponent Na+:H+ antiporter subunit G
VSADILVPLALALTVAAAWLACLSLLRLRRALDRLHAVAFLNAAAALPVSAAAFATDGLSVRSVKVVLVMLLTLGWGAALAHATGRALLLRDGPAA